MTKYLILSVALWACLLTKVSALDSPQPDTGEPQRDYHLTLRFPAGFLHERWKAFATVSPENEALFVEMQKQWFSKSGADSSVPEDLKKVLPGSFRMEITSGGEKVSREFSLRDFNLQVADSDPGSTCDLVLSKPIRMDDPSELGRFGVALADHHPFADKVRFSGPVKLADGSSARLKKLDLILSTGGGRPIEFEVHMQRRANYTQRDSEQYLLTLGEAFRPAGGHPWIVGILTVLGVITVISLILFFLSRRNPKVAGVLSRVGGGVLILYAVAPVFIIALLLSCILSFVSETRSDIGTASEDISFLMNNAESSAALVAAVIDTEVTEIQHDLAEIKRNSSAISNEAWGQITSQVDQLKSLPGKVSQNVKNEIVMDAGMAAMQVMMITNTVSSRLDEVFEHPTLKLPFGLPAIEFPDPGFGSAISGVFRDAFGGVRLPDLGGLIHRLSEDVTEPFAKPVSDLHALKDNLAEAVAAEKEEVAELVGRVHQDIDALVVDLRGHREQAVDDLHHVLDDLSHLTAEFGSLFHWVAIGISLFLIHWMFSGAVNMWRRIKLGWGMLMGRGATLRE